MKEASPFKLIGGHVALDFVNTLDYRYDPERTVDLIHTYEEFLQFCLQSGIVTGVEADSLRRRGPQEIAAALRRASEMRETCERIFGAIAGNVAIPPADLEMLTGLAKEAAQHRALAERGGSIEWQWRRLEQDAAGPLWPVAEAAAGLLVSEDVKLVRQCGSEDCRWLFLDSSKNHSRRWCDMKLCGNRVKARNHYRRTRP